MSFRTNPDRILDSIDRARDRAAEARADFSRQAVARELDTEIPGLDDTMTERARRVFGLVQRAYMSTAQSADLRQLAQRFQSIGDISNHHGRGDVTLAIHFIDADRPDAVAMSPFEIFPEQFLDEKKVTKTSRADINGLRLLRARLRDGVQSAYAKLEPTVRDAIRDRADMGHLAAQITVDLRPGG